MLLPLLGRGQQQQQNTTVTISQVYGGGGNTTSPVAYTNDFIELHNISTAPVVITGYVLQYAAAATAFGTASNLNSITLIGSIAAGGYFLVGLGTGGTPGTALPATDASNTGMNLNATAGKVVLASSNSTTGILPTSTNTVDYVGYGVTASTYEGIGPAPSSTGNAFSILRNGNGCLDTNQNDADFSVATTATPRNSASAAVMCPLAPLPVSLTRFTAARSGSSVVLSWATASETNSARFEVERSFDGVSFTKVATVAAAGNSLVPLSYTALDRNAPIQLLYYRLRQVDQDGSSRYPATVTMAGETTVAPTTISPNPAHASISLTTATATPYVLRSTLGQVVLSGATQPGTPTTVGLQSLAAGVYFFELQASAGRVVRKLVKE